MKRKLGKISARIILERGVACQEWASLNKIKKAIAPKKLVSAIDILENKKVYLTDRLYSILRLSSRFGTYQMLYTPHVVPDNFMPKFVMNKLMQWMSTAIPHSYSRQIEFRFPMGIFFSGALMFHKNRLKTKNKLITLLKEWENASD